MSRQTIITCDICKGTIPPVEVVSIEVATGETLPTLRPGDEAELEVITIDVCPQCLSGRLARFLRELAAMSSDAEYYTRVQSELDATAPDVQYYRLVQFLLGDNVAQLVAEREWETIRKTFASSSSD